MDLLARYSPDQLALIDQLRRVARQKALADEAADVTAESLRRLNALGFWRRLYVNSLTRFWSTVAVLLYVLSKWVPGVRGGAVAAAHRVLQPHQLYPELRDRREPTAPGTALSEGERKAAALRAIAAGIETLPADGKGNLSVETALQVEEIARWIDARGADEGDVRGAIKRIRDGESLVDTMKRGL